MYCFIPKQKMKNIYLNNSLNILVNIVVDRYLFILGIPALTSF